VCLWNRMLLRKYPFFVFPGDTGVWSQHFALASVGIKDPPVPKTDTQETENLDKAISLDQEGASMCSLPLSNTQAQNGQQWLLLISLMQSCLPLTWDLSRSKVHSLPPLAKRLGGWVRACSLAGIRKKKQGPFKHASHLRWGPEEFLSNLRE
jgi:hypothetical protein